MSESLLEGVKPVELVWKPRSVFLNRLFVFFGLSGFERKEKHGYFAFENLPQVKAVDWDPDERFEPCSFGEKWISTFSKIKTWYYI